MGKFNALFKLDIAAFNCAASIISTVRAPVLFRDRDYLKRNIELKRHKRSSRCYILGLGPSLSKVDFNALDGDTIATNRFVLCGQPESFSPTFYCMTDGAFFGGNASDILAAARKQYPESIFILNGKYRTEIEKLIGVSESQYYAYLWKGFLNPRQNVDLCSRIPIMGNVACFAILCALYIGYREIVLLGCDFSSFASNKSIHAYAESDTSRKITLSFELFCYSFVAYTHELLHQYAVTHDVNILNATPGSLIDAYPFSTNLIEKLHPSLE